MLLKAKSNIAVIGCGYWGKNLQFGVLTFTVTSFKILNTSLSVTY